MGRGLGARGPARWGLAAAFLLLAAAAAVPGWRAARAAVRRGDLLQNSAPLVRALADHWREHGRFPPATGALNPPWDLTPGSPGSPGTLRGLRWDEEPWASLAAAGPATTPTRVRFAYFSEGRGDSARAWLYALHDFDGDAAGWDDLGWDCTRLWIAASGPEGTRTVAAERTVWRGDE